MKYKWFIIPAGAIVIRILTSIILQNVLANIVVLSLIYVSMIVVNQSIHNQISTKRILGENAYRLIVLVAIACIIQYIEYPFIEIFCDPLNVDIVYIGVHSIINITFLLSYVLFSYRFLNVRKSQIGYRRVLLQVFVILVATILCDIGYMIATQKLSQMGNLWELPLESVSSFMQIFSGPISLMKIVSHLNYAIEITQFYIVAMITWKYAKVQSDRDVEEPEEPKTLSESGKNDMGQE